MVIMKKARAISLLNNVIGKALLVGLSAVLLISCDNDSDIAEQNAIITSMTIPTSGYQTMMPVNLSSKSNTALSEFVYAKLTDGDVLDSDHLDIEFGCENCEDEAVKSLPTITRIYDINKKYTMINMNHNAVAWHGSMYLGNYPVILDKTTGKLYPIIFEGEPVELDSYLYRESPFFSKLKSSDITPDDKLYSNNMSNGGQTGNYGLFEAELKGGGMIVSTIVPDAIIDEGFFMVDSAGNIFTYHAVPTQEPGKLVLMPLYIRNDEDRTTIAMDWPQVARFDAWRLIDGTIAATELGSAGQERFFSYMKWDGTKLFKPELTSFKNEGRGAHPSSSHKSPMVNGYDVNEACFVNQFDDSGYSFVAQSDGLFTNGSTAYASGLTATKSSLFCTSTHGLSLEDRGSVKVFKFDTNTQMTASYDTGIRLYDENLEPARIGTYAVSNDVVMVYALYYDYSVEYYINPVKGDYHTVIKNEGSKDEAIITPVGFLSL